MAFTKKIGLNLSFDQVSSDNLNSFFFSEEAGLVIQVADQYCEDHSLMNCHQKDCQQISLVRFLRYKDLVISIIK